MFGPSVRHAIGPTASTLWGGDSRPPLLYVANVALQRHACRHVVSGSLARASMATTLGRRYWVGGLPSPTGLIASTASQ